MTADVSLVLIVYMSLCVRVYSEGCHSLEYTRGNECDEHTNCSQNARFPGDANFLCTIYRREGWDRFERDKGPFTSIVNVSQSFHPPNITYIEWNLQRHDKSKYPALRLNYTIPYYITENGQSTHYLVKAVRMIWAGIKNKDAYYDDLSYSTSERYIYGYYRLFDFHKYEGTSKDKTTPRMIQYDCITGLDTCNSNEKFYILELSAIAFKPQPFILSLDYYITTFNQQGERWEPAIVTAIYPDFCSIYVVFEQAPDNYSITEYKLNLIYADTGSNKHTENIKAKNRYSHTFTDLARNVYKIEVVAIGGVCDNSTCKYTTYKVNITSSECVNYGDIIEEHSDPAPKAKEKYLAVIIGIVGGLVFLAILAVLVYHQKCKIKKDINQEVDRKTVFILYSNKSKTDEDKIAKLANTIRIKCPSYEVVFELEMIYDSVKKWYQSQIAKASVVLIVCPGPRPEDWKDEDGRINKHTPIQPYFHSAWEYAANFVHNNKTKNKRIVLLCFDSSHKSAIPLDLKDKKVFLLPKQYNKLCSCLKSKSYITCFGNDRSMKQEPHADGHESNYLFLKEEHESDNAPETVKPVKDPNITSGVTPSIDCPVHGTKRFTEPCPIHGKIQYLYNHHFDYWSDNDIHQNNYLQTINEEQHRITMPTSFNKNGYLPPHSESRPHDEQRPFLSEIDNDENYSTGLFPHVQIVEGYNDVNKSQELPADDDNESMDDLFQILEEMNF